MRRGHTPGTGTGEILRVDGRSLRAAAEYAAPAGLPLDQAVTALAHGATECEADIEKHCAKVEAGEGRIIKCLEKHEAELSQRCKQAKKDIGLD